MQRRFTKIRLFSPLLSVKLKVIGCLLLTVNCLLSSASYSQVSSAAYDPKCYFPKIGKIGEIDTIYGAREQQNLGGDMMNLGPNPDNTYGRLSSSLNSPITSVFKSWPDFNLHKLQVLGKFDLGPGSNTIVRFAHFHSQKYLDILSYRDGVPSRIYWEDDNGTYDSSSYTELRAHLKPKNGNDYSNMQPYSAHISSDTVEDIIYSVLVNNTNNPDDSVYLLYFKGGQNLKNQGKKAYADSTVFYDTLAKFQGTGRVGFQGDFRGIGRVDFVAYNIYGDMFYYKNDLPFSLSSVVHSLKYDTLFSQWQNPKAVNRIAGIVMQALSKTKGDSSSDLLTLFLSDYGRAQQVQEYRIFRGGKDFGSHRWTADSAEFVLHEPYYYDSQYGNMAYGFGLKDCGHMTGTKNRVLYVEALLDGGFYGYEFFYVLGDAIDDKIDMEIGPIDNHGGAGNFVDTLVADNDNLQDIIMGESGYGFNTGNEQNGSIYVVHGSRLIPERTRTVHIVENKNWHITIFPNPIINGTCTLDLSDIDQQDMQIDIWDLLGRKVYSEHIYAPFMRPRHSIFINSLSSGTYILDVAGKNFSQRIQLSVLK